MILFSQIISDYKDELIDQYANQFLPGHFKAINAMQICRTDDSLMMKTRCSNCRHEEYVPHSCGHRFCPHCQHHGSSRPFMVLTAFRLLSIKVNNGLNVNARNFYPSIILW